MERNVVDDAGMLEFHAERGHSVAAGALGVVHDFLGVVEDPLDLLEIALLVLEETVAHNVGKLTCFETLEEIKLERVRIERLDEFFVLSGLLGQGVQVGSRDAGLEVLLLLGGH